MEAGTFNCTSINSNEMEICEAMSAVKCTTYGVQDLLVTTKVQ